MDDEIKQIETNIQKLSIESQKVQTAQDKELRRLALKMIEYAFTQYNMRGIKTAAFITGRNNSKGVFKDSYVGIKQNNGTYDELVTTSMYVDIAAHNKLAKIVKDIIREKELNAKSTDYNDNLRKAAVINITIL